MSRFATTIFTCLLALLVASPLCCCAGEAFQAKQTKSCCCCGDTKEQKKKNTPGEACLCNTQEPREAPDAVLPPQPGAGVAIICPPASEWLPLALESTLEFQPRWQPAVPWHAPPAERRALLVSRTL